MKICNGPIFHFGTTGDDDDDDVTKTQTSPL
jgi:hypothetical protein